MDLKHLIQKHFVTAASILFMVSFAVFLNINAASHGPKYNPGQTLNPACSPGDTDCSVLIPSGGGVWSSITGTLSTQTDLQNALNAKQATGLYLVAGDITGKEDVLNKQTDLTASATKYPTVDAVIAGLSLKQPTGTYSTDIHSNITALDAVTNTNTGDGAINSLYSGLATSKQDSLGFTPENFATKNMAGGYPSLDGVTGKILISQIPSVLMGAVVYKGTWNASTNTPTLTTTSNVIGEYYVINVVGSIDPGCSPACTSWVLGDWIIFNGTNWEKVENNNSVTSVNGFTGVVNLTPILGSYVDGAPVVFSSTPNRTFKQFAPTLGSVLFSGIGGILEQDNANLFWDNASKRLGVGTVTPGRQVTISSTSYPIISLQSSGPNGGAIELVSDGDNITGKIISIYNQAGNLRIRPHNDAIFPNGGITMMQTTGNVGIGTTTPGVTGYDTKLHIKGSGAGVSGRTISVVENTNATSAASFMLVNSAGKQLAVQISGPSYVVGESAGISTAGGLPLTLATDGGVLNTGTSHISFQTGGYGATQETMRITAKGSAGSGNVGIGTITPGAKLEVAGQVKITGGSPGLNKVLTSDADGLASWQTAGAGSGWGLTGNTGTTASTAAIGVAVNNNFIGTTDAKDFVFASNNLERMRIASGGNVGIGTTSPTSKLHITETGPNSNYDSLVVDFQATAITNYLYSSAGRFINKLATSSHSYSIGVLGEAIKTGNYGNTAKGVVGQGIYRSNVVGGIQLNALDLYGVQGTVLVEGTGANTINSGRSIHATATVATGNTLSTHYGVYVEAPTGAGTITNKYALVTEAAAGNVGIGVTTPLMLLHVVGGIGHGPIVTSVQGQSINGNLINAISPTTLSSSATGTEFAFRLIRGGDSWS